MTFQILELPRVQRPHKRGQTTQTQDKRQRNKDQQNDHGLIHRLIGHLKFIGAPACRQVDIPGAA